MVSGDDRARAIAAFMNSSSVTGLDWRAFVGSAAWSPRGVHGLAGWQRLFLVEGLPAIVLGSAVFLWLPDKPDHATWLNESQRDWLLGQLASEGNALPKNISSRCAMR